jgi:hypothetical protein
MMKRVTFEPTGQQRWVDMPDRVSRAWKMIGTNERTMTTIKTQVMEVELTCGHWVRLSIGKRYSNGKTLYRCRVCAGDIHR